MRSDFSLRLYSERVLLSRLGILVAIFIKAGLL